MVRPWHTRPDPGHDLIGNRAERLAPLLGGRFPVIPRSEEHDLVPLRRWLITEVDDQLVHADCARDRPPATPRENKRQITCAARYPVRVTKWHESEGRLPRRGVPVPVRPAGPRRNALHERQPGP